VREIDIEKELEAAMQATADVPSVSPLLQGPSVVSMADVLNDEPDGLFADLADLPISSVQSEVSKPAMTPQVEPSTYTPPTFEQHVEPTQPTPMSAVAPALPAIQSVPAPEPTVSLPAGEKLVQKSFDPLAILLAGRENAGIGHAEEFIEGTELSRSVDEDVEEYLCFRVATESYAINIMSIKEIIKPREVTEVPRMPEFVTGILSLRGVIIPNIDMRLRLGLPVGAPAGKERVVVVKNEDNVCGILVDEVVQVVRLHRQTIEQPPAVLEGIDRDFVKGIGRINDRMLILLNLESILDLALR
jgi:purine-binding chemotaxis protein CheW